MFWCSVGGGGWGGCAPNQPREEVDVNALAEEMASLGFIQGWGGRVPDVESHEEFADVGSGFQK